MASGMNGSPGQTAVQHVTRAHGTATEPVMGHITKVWPVQVLIKRMNTAMWILHALQVFDNDFLMSIKVNSSIFTAALIVVLESINLMLIGFLILHQNLCGSIHVLPSKICCHGYYVDFALLSAHSENLPSLDIWRRARTECFQGIWLQNICHWHRSPQPGFLALRAESYHLFWCLDTLSAAFIWSEESESICSRNKKSQVPEKESRHQL